MNDPEHPDVEPDELLDRALPEPDPIDGDHVVAAYEERLAEQRLAAIEAGRRKGGVAGAAMAGAMLAVNEIVEGPPKDDAPVTVEASSDPHDLDTDGFEATVGETDVAAPPLEPLPPVVDDRKRPRL